MFRHRATLHPPRREGEQRSGRNPTDAWLCNHDSARETDQRKDGPRGTDPLAQKKGRTDDHEQRPRLKNGSSRTRAIASSPRSLTTSVAPNVLARAMRSA
jgi:hypothetical protein